jgi:hypothetical protein
MSGVNRYHPHVLVLPEDRANEELANGFSLKLELNQRSIQILRHRHGWKTVLEEFSRDYIARMREYPKTIMILLMDFDEDKDRANYVKEQIPEDLKARVFVLGVLSEPEALKRDLVQGYEAIGETLATDCFQETNGLWSHELLKHNRVELKRMVSSMRSLLFD